jgi:release factor glutamine methyltransferase
MAEDSFILLDALEEDQQYMNGLCVEIGSGSGIVSTFVANMGAVCICTDINKYAVEATAETAKQNKVHLDVVCTNLLDPLRPGVVDVLCFNPPYVETDDDE